MLSLSRLAEKEKVTSPVVHDEDARPDALSNHGGYFLSGQLEGPIPDDGYNSSRMTC